MALLVSAEESHLLLRFLRNSLLTLNIIRENVADIFALYFFRKPGIDMAKNRSHCHQSYESLPYTFEDLIGGVRKKCQVKTQDLFPGKQDFHDDGDPVAVLMCWIHCLRTAWSG